MTAQGAPRHGGEGDGYGCLVVAIRLPIRVLAVIVVLPVRLAWDALCALGRAVRTGLDRVYRHVLYPLLRLLAIATAWLIGILVLLPAALLWRYVLRPVLTALAWTVRELVRWLLVVPAVALWRHVLTPLGLGTAWTVRALWEHVLRPVGRWLRRCLVALGGGVGRLTKALVLLPAAWLWRAVLVPVVRGAADAVAFLTRWLLVVPAVSLWRYVVVPVGRGTRWLLLGALRVLIVLPAVFVWRWIVVPVAREAAAALGHAWRVTAYVSRAVGRGLAWLFRTLVALPVAWVWTRTVAPAFRAAGAAGRWIRREILRPMREAVAEARQSVRIAVFGPPRKR
jgi:hypothetical protein